MIGISAGLLNRKVPKTITKERYHLSTDYIDAVSNAGAIACMLPILKPEKAKEVIRQVDGLILSGGNDVAQHLAEQQWQNEPNIQPEVSLARDLYELELCREALRQNKPILGICRGAQVLNVVQGGTLHQEILNTSEIVHIQREKPQFGSHTIEISETSTLYEILGKREVLVNSYHHQAIKKLGKNLKIVAKAEDNYIEAIEYTGNEFAIGLQWHPEVMASHFEANAVAIFNYFVTVVYEKSVRIK